LNHTGYFEPYENEYIDKCGDDRMLEHGMAFCEWMRIIKNKESFERNPPKFLKNIYEQHLSAIGQPDIKYIRSILPNIRFVVLIRSDIIAHIASLYMAEYTKTWHIWGRNGAIRYKNIRVDIRDDLLVECIDRVMWFQNNWSDLLNGHEYVIVKYEDLCDNCYDTLISLNASLGLEIDSDVILKSIRSNRLSIMRDQHGSTNEIIGSIKDACLKYII